MGVHTPIAGSAATEPEEGGIPNTGNWEAGGAKTGVGTGREYDDPWTGGKTYDGLAGRTYVSAGAGRTNVCAGAGGE